MVLGFYDDIPPKDRLQDRSFHSSRSLENPVFPDEPEDPVFHFPPLRGSMDGAWQGKVIGPQEYVSVIADAVKMLKNVALARYFCQFDHTRARQNAVFVDVWPVNLLRPDSCSYVDTCSLFLLQLACILNMTRAWRKARLRLFLCVETGRSLKEAERKLGQLLKELRMKADIFTVPWDAQVALHWQRQTSSKKRKKNGGETEEEAELEEEEEEESESEEEEYANGYHSNTSRLTDDYLLAVNRLISDQPCPPPAVRFLYLPRPPADTRRYCDYLHQLELLSRDLGPTLLIHGVTPVITTDL